MSFLVVPPGRPPVGGLGFILRQDNWNDYGFRTQYQLFFGSGDGPPDLIGNVKVLRRGQVSADYLQLERGEVNALGEGFCSVGQSLDYYERLAALGPDLKNQALNGLRDVVQDSSLVSEFEKEQGWRVSLFRDFGPDADFLRTASSLINRDYSSLPRLDLKFSFSPGGWRDSLELSFSAPSSRLDDPFLGGFERGAQGLPSRMIVLVGRNGSGKSTILARLARVAHASAGDRQRRNIRNLGVLEPKGIGFTRIISISYSAFDSFAAPGLNLEDRVQVAKEISSGSGRYMFCGLRDMGRELEDVVRHEAGYFDDSELVDDRLSANRIKSLDKLTDEFELAMARIRSGGREQTFMRCMRPILLDPSLYEAGGTIGFELFGDDLRGYFHGLSTGHKIVLHSMASLVSYVERKSLILFDEPETHLHPPLLSSLMHAIRIALDDLDAFAVVATHSPVVVQEALSRHVHKIVREGEVGRIFPAEIETFGESIGSITNEVFSLDASATDYHAALEKLAVVYGNLDSIEGVFERGLSTQARAYVMSVISRNK